MGDLLGWGAFLLGIGLGIKWFLGQQAVKQDAKIAELDKEIAVKEQELKQVEQVTKQKEQSYEAAKKNFTDRFGKYINKPK
jgi:uncharacterized protein HemX